MIRKNLGYVKREIVRLKCHRNPGAAGCSMTLWRSLLQIPVALQPGCYRENSMEIVA